MTAYKDGGIEWHVHSGRRVFADDGDEVFGGTHAVVSGDTLSAEIHINLRKMRTVAPPFIPLIFAAIADVEALHHAANLGYWTEKSRDPHRWLEGEERVAHALADEIWERPCVVCGGRIPTWPSDELPAVHLGCGPLR